MKPLQGSSSSSGNSKAAKITRRHMAALFAAAPMIAQEQPKAQKAKTSEAASSLDQTYANVRKASERLREIHLPISVEPAFFFKA